MADIKLTNEQIIAKIKSIDQDSVQYNNLVTKKYGIDLEYCAKV